MTGRNHHAFRGAAFCNPAGGYGGIGNSFVPAFGRRGALSQMKRNSVLSEEFRQTFGFALRPREHDDPALLAQIILQITESKRQIAVESRRWACGQMNLYAVAGRTAASIGNRLLHLRAEFKLLGIDHGPRRESARYVLPSQIELVRRRYGAAFLAGLLVFGLQEHPQALNLSPEFLGLIE